MNHRQPRLAALFAAICLGWVGQRGGRAQTPPTDPASQVLGTNTSLETALNALGKLRPDAPLYTYAAGSGTDLTMVVEIAGREIEAGRWKAGGTVSVSANAPAGSDTMSLVAEGRIDPGARSALITIRIPPGQPMRSWKIVTKVRGSDGLLEDTTEAITGEANVIGAPLFFRAGPSLRAPVRWTAEPQFIRTERIHIEWPVEQSDAPRTVRLLGRRGNPVPIALSVSERETDDGVVVVADASLAPLAPGDYLLEMGTRKGAEPVTRLFAFRIAR